jgi:hypothetical protein
MTVTSSIKRYKKLIAILERKIAASEGSIRALQRMLKKTINDLSKIKALEEK